MDTPSSARHAWSWRDDPQVPPFPGQHPLIVFDGLCVLCSANAQFVLRRDRARRFRLTAAQSPLGQALYRHFALIREDGDYDTMLVIEDGRLLTESDAAIAIARGLGRPYSLAAAAAIVPRGLRDAVYRLIARNRFRLFGRRDSCWMPEPEDRDRIL
jgi:predicted DCC family thiol-disulfide oxidoreductase YuxK